MRTKHTAAYAIARLPDPTGVDKESHARPVLVLDKTGVVMSDTNKARLDAKLELLQSISDDFKDCRVECVTLVQIAI